MLSYPIALILGLLQGASELFPVSSLGHSVLVPALFHIHIADANAFLVFLVATHLATSVVLFFFFLPDWIRIIGGVFRSIKIREIRTDDVYAKLGWLIIVGTIPAGILGLLFEDQLKTLLASPFIVAPVLVVNGVMLWGIEKLKKNSKENSKLETLNPKENSKLEILNPKEKDDVRIAQLSWAQTVKIGFAEALALIPGISRTGSTLGGGLLTGLDHEQAARFSFLMATPIILAASVLKLPELLTPELQPLIGPIILGAIASGIAAYLSVRYLTKYFRSHDLKPFAYYCIVAGLVSLVVILL